MNANLSGRLSDFSIAEFIKGFFSGFIIVGIVAPVALVLLIIALVLFVDSVRGV